MTSSTATPREAAVSRAMERAGVPRRYRDVEPSGLVSGGLPWAYITGAAGSGKTHMACAILRAYLDVHVVKCELTDFAGRVVGTDYYPPTAHFVTASGYLDSVRRGFDGDGTAEAYLRSPFLVLDDLGQEVPTQWAVGEVFRLVDFRYANLLPTVITSQFPRDRLARRLAGNGGMEQAVAIASRLMEACEVRDLGDEDRRLHG